MTDLVRVKLVDSDDEGTENVRYATVGAEFAEAQGLEVIDGMRAVDNRGVALDFKPHVSVDEAAETKELTPAQKAAETRRRNAEQNGDNQ